MDKAPDAPSSGLKELSEKELVEKAALAADQLEQEGTETDTLIHFVGARKLRNGGVIYELDMAEGANRLKENANMTRFLQAFSATSVIKHRTYPVIAEYAPISFDPNDRAQLDEVGRSSRMNQSSILNGQWIKPIHHRSQEQCMAHAILGFTQPANEAIRNGVIIAGKRVWARKLLQEPRRCLKCQKIGAMHIAAECEQDHNTCGNCGRNHCTAECEIRDPAQYKRANCKEMGHTAWDRHCPTFTRANAHFNARHPVNSYRYYPTTLDPTSWEQLGVNKLSSGELKQDPGWMKVNRQQRGPRPGTAAPRSRPNPMGRGNTTRGTQRAAPATGANTIPGPNANTPGSLRQTTLLTGWGTRTQKKY